MRRTASLPFISSVALVDSSLRLCHVIIVIWAPGAAAEGTRPVFVNLAHIALARARRTLFTVRRFSSLRRLRFSYVPIPTSIKRELTITISCVAKIGTVARWPLGNTSAHEFEDSAGALIVTYDHEPSVI